MKYFFLFIFSFYAYWSLFYALLSLLSCSFLSHLFSNEVQKLVFVFWEDK